MFPRDGPGVVLIRDGAISLDAAEQDSVLGTNGPGITSLCTASRKAPPLRLMNDGLSLTPRAGAVFLTLSSFVVGRLPVDLPQLLS
jgi:hypothetical protein